MKSQKPGPQKPYNYLTYSGLGIQIIAIVLLGVLAGLQLDRFFDLQRPIFTISLAVVSVFVAIVYLVRKLL